jgi:hypothetical protein
MNSYSADALAFLKTCPQTRDSLGERIAMWRRLSPEDERTLREWNRAKYGISDTINDPVDKRLPW